MTCPRVETIAFCLLGLPPEKQHKLLADALNKAYATRPDLSPDVVIPWTEGLLAEIRQRLTELEQTEGHG